VTKYLREPGISGPRQSFSAAIGVAAHSFESVIISLREVRTTTRENYGKIKGIRYFFAYGHVLTINEPRFTVHQQISSHGDFPKIHLLSSKSEKS